MVTVRFSNLIKSKTKKYVYTVESDGHDDIHAQYFVFIQMNYDRFLLIFSILMPSVSSNHLYSLLTMTALISCYTLRILSHFISTLINLINVKLLIFMQLLHYLITFILETQNIVQNTFYTLVNVTANHDTGNYHQLKFMDIAVNSQILIMH